VGPQGFNSRGVTLTASGVREVQRLRRPPAADASSPAAAQPRPGQPGSVLNNYNVYNNSGPMSWNGTNYSQTVNNGLDVEAILRGAQQLRQLLSEAQLRTYLANSRFCSSPTTAPTLRPQQN
jgi:hypothetical protein